MTQYAPLRVLFLLVAATLTFCASPRAEPIVVAPVASAAPVPHPAPAPLSPGAPRQAPDAAQAKRRIDAARQAYVLVAQSYTNGGSSIDDVGEWSDRLFFAQRDGGQVVADAAQERLERMKKLETTAGQKVAAGLATPADRAKAAFFRVDAEIALAGSQSP